MRVPIVAIATTLAVASVVVSLNPNEIEEVKKKHETCCIQADLEDLMKREWIEDSRREALHLPSILSEA